MIRSTITYKTHDGQLFESQSDAQARADDMLGEALDGLIKMATGTTVVISRSQEYKIIMAWLNDRQKLRALIDNLQSVMAFGDDETEEGDDETEEGDE